MLDPGRAARHLDLRLHPPQEGLSPWVHHHWFIDWNVVEPYTQSVLGRPCANVVVDGGRLMLTGPQTHRFDRDVEGRGSVYGTQLWPASLQPFVDRPIKTYVDQRVDIGSLWGVDAADLEGRLREAPDDVQRVQLLTQLISAQHPARPDEMAEANQVVRHLEGHPDITKVSQLSEATGLGTRSLQRLLSTWVGMGPKQLIRRFRLQEASARIAEGQAVDLTELAYALGYADQAHFSRDFKRLVGVPPSSYAARQ